jgi:hypothetical protein
MAGFPSVKRARVKKALHVRNEDDSLTSPRGYTTATRTAQVGSGKSTSEAPLSLIELVCDGRMPQPKQIDGRKVWDIRSLDRAFDQLPGGAEEPNEWDLDAGA